MPTEILVAPDECRFARQGEILLARHLISDWAVAIHHPEIQTGALARFGAQPDATIRQALFAMRPPAGPRYGWRAYVIGGASAPGDERAARQAQSSRLAIQASFWREGVLVKGEDAGGRHARTVYFDPAAGRLIVRAAVPLAARVPPVALPCPLAS
jgi:CheD chemotactic sensory transduction protein